MIRGWQLVPSSITSTKIHYWRNGSLVTKEMSPTHAKHLVKTGRAFVVNSHTIQAWEKHLKGEIER